ncbi:MAG TPA: hypothetical protein PKD49_10305 [Hyphomicrobium sp.]|nr:hypothetical protein [Hyphomicrobium sp.]
MKYQLVLQFQGDDEETLEKVVALEDQLIEELGGSTLAEVDGHEEGDGSIYVLIETKNPSKLWERIEPVVEAAASNDLEATAVAYRERDSDDYTVLWPADYEGEFEVV